MVERKKIKYWRDLEKEYQKINNPSIKKLCT
jgi:Fe-S cluster assembly iron-binding protein IscA